MEHHNFMPFFDFFQKEANLRTSQSRVHSDLTLSQLSQSRLPPSQDIPLCGLQRQCTHYSWTPVSPRPRTWHNASFSNFPSLQGESQASSRELATRTHSLTASEDSCMYTRLLLEASAARDSRAAPATPRPRTTSAPPSLLHIHKMKHAQPQQRRYTQEHALGTLTEVDELTHTAKDTARMKPLPRLPLNSPGRTKAARRSNEQGKLVVFGWMAASERRYGSLVGASVAIMEGRGIGECKV